MKTGKRVGAGIAAAVSAVLVAAGAGMVLQQRDTDQQLAPMEPAPSRTTISPAATPRALPAEDDVITAGTYAVGVNGFIETGAAPVPVLRIPDGYHGFEWAVYAPAGATADTVPPDMHAVQFWGVKKVYDDPCDPDKLAVDPGPTVADLARALGARDFVSVPPGPVSVAGYDGMYLETIVPDVDFATCGDGSFDSWTTATGGRYHQGPGQVDRLWILDVDGYRLVIDAWHMPGSTSTQVDTLTRMVEGITFTNPS